MTYSKRFLTINQFKRESTLSRHCIEKGIADGTIPYLKSGNRTLIDTEIFEKQRAERA